MAGGGTSVCEREEKQREREREKESQTANIGHPIRSESNDSTALSAVNGSGPHTRAQTEA